MGVSEEQFHRYEEWLKQGFTMSDIASTVGCHPNTVRNHLKAHRMDLYALAMVNAAKTRGWGALKARQRKEVGRSALSQEQVTRAMRWLQRKGVCFPMSVRQRGAKDYYFKGQRISAAQILEEAFSRGWVDESSET